MDTAPGSGRYRGGFLGGDDTPIRALAGLDDHDIVIVVRRSPGKTLRRKEHEGPPVPPAARPGRLSPQKRCSTAVDSMRT
ncbi:hypothetical protein [Streptomyces sp. NPDC014676]|uniref:hypothetical protein n=1 Tax=Streptomyces sp. NPDC014676 TaxID=3364879 RepID=UPI0036FDFA56